MKGNLFDRRNAIALTAMVSVMLLLLGSSLFRLADAASAESGSGENNFSKLTRKKPPDTRASRVA